MQNKQRIFDHSSKSMYNANYFWKNPDPVLKNILFSLINSEQ